MSDTKPRLYEGLFLFNAATVGSNIAQATEIVNQLVQRAGGTVDIAYKWDDRKLAYKLEGQKRGLYILAYFTVDGKQVAHIERDVTLSEDVLRCLIIRADHVGETELELARDAEKTSQAAAAMQGEEGEASEAESAVAVAEDDSNDSSDDDSSGDDDSNSEDDK
ncbi:30S ribosomal protein S6 [Planctomycetales bacterium ZRK34]|nr:30S ribosomal protein S6 [Planctomycetales bacterium ZRK34]